MLTHAPGPRRREDGASAVEFALILIPFMVLLLGMLQYGWYFYAANAASSAAREGARRVVVGNCQDDSALTALIREHANDNTATVSRSYTPSATPKIGETAVISVQVNAAIINFLPMPDGGLVTKTVKARIEDLDASSPGAC